MALKECLEFCFILFEMICYPILPISNHTTYLVSFLFSELFQHVMKW